MLKPVYALVGAEPYLQLRELRTILEQSGNDIERIDLDGERTSLGDVLDHLRSFAMFGGGKIVVVRDAGVFISEHRDGLEDYVAKPADNSTLILRVNSLPANQRIHKLIAKVGRIIQCEPPKDAALRPWIIAHARKEHGITVDADAAGLLAELIGVDLGRLDSEISKLALMTDDGKVTREMVDGSVAFQREQAMSKLTDTLGHGDVRATVKKWRELLQTDPAAEFRAVTWLHLWLQRLMRVIQLSEKRVDPYAIARELRVWPLENVKPMINLGQRLGRDGIRAAVERLLRVDARSKSGLGDATTNVESFLLSMA